MDLSRLKPLSDNLPGRLRLWQPSINFHRACLLILLSLQIGCSSSANLARRPVPYAQLKRGTDMGVIRLNGREFDQAQPLPPGEHAVDVNIPWSNGLWENVHFMFNAEAGHTYEIMRFELKPGQDPATIEPASAAEPFLDFGRFLLLPFAYALYVPVVATSIIWGPIADSMTPTQPNSQDAPPDRRPFENCCYVWIQDFDAQKIAAGVSPAGKVFSTLAGFSRTRSADTQ
jgi:hypothetical protein